MVRLLLLKGLGLGIYFLWGKMIFYKACDYLDEFCEHIHMEKR